MQGSSPIGWNCRRFVLVPFYCKTSSHWFLGLIDIFVLVGNAPIGQFELLLLIQILAGKFDFWREIWMLAGRLLMSFPVHHFRWRHFLSFPVTSGDIISVDATSGDVTSPDCSTTNMTWMVLLYLDKKSDLVPTDVSVSLTIKCIHIYKRELGSRISTLKEKY